MEECHETLYSSFQNKKETPSGIFDPDEKEGRAKYH
jgi:hypothetical protein